MSETVLGLLRHGQTDWNIDFKLQGVTDIPLNETGIGQARDAARAIDSNEWDLIVSSPLSRAVATAEIVSKENNFGPIKIEPLLLERSFGEAEGLSYEDWKSKYTDSNAVPGAETLMELEARARLLLEGMLRDFRGKRILAISHGALIRKLLKITSAGQLPREGERLGNASLNVLVHTGNHWIVELYEPRTLHLDLHH
ncbi:MAG: histidine phosphatase family protein [Rhodoluna sp.]